MQLKRNLSLASLSLAFMAPLAFSQSFQAHSIQFIGSPDYADQELLSTAGVAPGSTFTYEEMNRAAQKLVDTGIFSSVSFKFDGQDLTFQLAPASGLVPLRLKNLPIQTGKDLDAKLHRQFPLYHGLLPAQGGLTESLRVALEQMLAAQNIKASIAAAPLNDPASHKPVAVGFSIVSPPVLVGDVRTEGAVIALDPKAAGIVAKFPGSLYDSENTLRGIETEFTAYYKNQGYPDPIVHAIAGAKPVVTGTDIRIPLRVSIAPGVQYKLAGIHLAPGLLVSQADFDRQFHFRDGDVPDGARLNTAWKFIERCYHDQGYIKAQINPSATINHSNNTLSYNVTVDPGPVYTMGKVSVDNVTDDLRSAMLAAWKMAPGTTFNESAIPAFFNTHGVNPSLEPAFAGIDYRYTLAPDDSARTVDVKLTLEKKP